MYVVIISYGLNAQPYHNEWIQPNQAYYKLQVAKEGLYRIPFNTLTTTNLPLTGKGFALFHNGKQIPIYVTTTEAFTSTDYIEFYGRPNDGTFDSLLFKNSTWQLHTDKSFFTDTATYFLTWQENLAQDFHYTSVLNNISNPPPPLSHFIHTEKKHFTSVRASGNKTKINNLYLNFSDFEANEGFSDEIISTGQNHTVEIPTPALANAVAANINATVQVKVIGKNNVITLAPDHHVALNVNNIRYADQVFEGLNNTIFSVNLPSTNLNSDVTNIQVTSIGDLAEIDVNAIAHISVTYPRAFDFDNKGHFFLELENNEKQYLEIANFDIDNQAVVYDLTNRIRLVFPKIANVVKGLLPAGEVLGEKRQLFMSNNTAAFAINTVQNLKKVNFVDFTDTDNIGDYLIITHNSFLANEANPIEDYVNYRSSETGGDFSVKVIDIESLYDQFAYGIRKHPLSIRHFINFAIDNWSIAPEYVFLIGEAMAYTRLSEPALFERCLVPTYGQFPSDYLLTTATPKSNKQQVAIGRLPAQSPEDIANYLEKVKAYEFSRQEAACDDEHIWRKQVLSLLGENEAYSVDTLQRYTSNYQNKFVENDFGCGVVGNYTLADNATQEIIQRINKGVGFLTYLGASDNGKWAYPINSSQLTNKDQYPFIVMAATGLGNVHSNNEDNLAKDLLLAKEKGSIGFLAETANHFPTISSLYLQHFLQIITTANYDVPIGKSMQVVVDSLLNTNEDITEFKADKYACENFTLLADPALIINPRSTPEYHLQEVGFYNPNNGFPLLTSPIMITNDMETFEIKVTINNFGKFTSDSLRVTVYRYWGDDNGLLTDSIIWDNKILAPKYTDNLTISIPNDDPLLPTNSSFVLFINDGFEAEEACISNNLASEIAHIEHYCASFPILDINEEINLSDTDFPFTLSTTPMPNVLYEWSTGEQGNSIEIGSMGTYTITALDTLTFCSTTKNITVTFSTGISPNYTNNWQVYPNPAKDKLQVIGKAKANCLIYNLQGQVVKNKQLQNGHNTLFINDLPAGIYLIKCVQKDKVFTQKLIIE